MSSGLQFKVARTLVRAYLALFDLRIGRFGFVPVEEGTPSPIVVCRLRSPIDPLLLAMYLPGEVAFSIPFETAGYLPHRLLASLFPVVPPPLPGERLPSGLTVIVFWDGDPRHLSNVFMLADAGRAPILPVVIGGSLEVLEPDEWLPLTGPIRIVAGEAFPAPSQAEAIHSGLSVVEASQALYERLETLETFLKDSPHTHNPFEPYDPHAAIGCDVPQAVSAVESASHPHEAPELPPWFDPTQLPPPRHVLHKPQATEKSLRILVTGASGQLGTELQRLAPARKIAITAVDLPHLDITDAQAVRAMIRPGSFDLVINAAAFTAVDKAETEADLAFRVNRDGPGNLAEACVDAGIPLFHISTDYVFAGNQDTPWQETDPVNPQSVYGRSKAEGETAVRTRLAHHLIIRTSWVYSPFGANFVKTILRLARERETLKIVADQRGCPTAAHDLAASLLQLADRVGRGEELAWGTWHYCGSGETTWHGFAEEIVRLAKTYEPLKVQVIEPITTDQYPLPAKRPAYSTLDCTETRDRLGIAAPPWQQSLTQVIADLYRLPERPGC